MDVVHANLLKWPNVKEVVEDLAAEHVRPSAVKYGLSARMVLAIPKI
jgi:hypothetical protein